LDDSGGVSDERHAPRLVQLMEEANDNLEQQALLLNVLLSTAHQLTLVRYPLLLPSEIAIVFF
jgi:hypothetical protein